MLNLTAKMNYDNWSKNILRGIKKCRLMFLTFKTLTDEKNKIKK